MPERLSDEARQHLIKGLGKGTAASKLAKDLGISPRHVYRLWARYQKTGDTCLRMGRPKDHITEYQIRLVTEAHQKQPVGVARTARELKKNHDTSYGRVYRILKKGGLVVVSPAKSKRRRRVRYERMYSNAMWHTDWHSERSPFSLLSTSHIH